MKTGDKKFLAWILFIFWMLAMAVSIFVTFIKENLIWFVISFAISTFTAIIIYVLVVRHWNRKERKLQEAILQTNINQVDGLTPYEFEEWVARFLRIAGYKAHTTKKSGDYGVDVLAEKDNTSIAIQVKKFTKPVGIKAIQEVISGMDYYNCYEGWVITTAPYFTQAAKNLAKTRNIKLYNKNDLAILLYELQKDNVVSISISELNSNLNPKYIEKDVTISESYNNAEIKKPAILRYEDKKYLAISECCSPFTYKVINYMLDKFKDDKFFEYNINNMPYIYEFINPGHFICKKLFGLLERENENASIYDIEYVNLSGMFYVGMGTIYLWKSRNNFNINETLDILIKKNGLLYLDETILNKFKIKIESENWKNFYEKFNKYQIDLLNDFDIDYIYHENDLEKYYSCMHAMYILGMLFAIQKLT